MTNTTCRAPWSLAQGKKHKNGVEILGKVNMDDLREMAVSEGTDFDTRWQLQVFLSDLSPSAKLVALAIRLYIVDQSHREYPSLKTISQVTKLSKGTVIGAIAALTSARLIESLVGAGRAPNVYRLALTPGFAPVAKPRYVKVPIPSALRLIVLERDGYRCRQCGSANDLAVDHIYPEFLGGEAVLTNLQTLCRPCNCRKGVRI